MGSILPLLAGAKRKFEEGDRAEAERLWKAVLAREPGNAGAAKGLGELLLEAQRHPEAFEIVGAAARRHPMDMGLRVIVGRAMFGLGMIGPAMKALQSVPPRDANATQAQVGVGMCLVVQRRASEAVSLLKPLAKARPDDPVVRHALGHALVHVGQVWEAIEHIQASARLRPTVEVLAELAWALYKNGQREEAARVFERAHAMNPKLPLVIAGRASILMDERRGDEARAILKDAARENRSDPLVLNTYARVVESSEERAAVRAMIEGALTHQLPPAVRSSLHFSMGTLLEADRDYERAFASFRAANEIGGGAVDESRLELALETVKRVFSRESMERMPRAAPDPLPVFIVGMPRSGTTLVEQILASHPGVHGAGELQDLSQLAKSMHARLGLPEGQFYPDVVGALTQEQMQDLADVYLGRLKELGLGALRVTDKMPRNYLLCGLIDVLFPGARIVHCVRDPLDTCVSIFTTSFGQGHACKSRLSTLAAMYRSYRRVMDHWRLVIRVPILDMVYEEMVYDLEGQAKRLVVFTGLPWDRACLSFYDNKRAVATASMDQVRRPIYSSSVGRWKRYEPYIGELIEGLREYL
jgi:tetratricopeptide (TPR) repeat protein